MISPPKPTRATLKAQIALLWHKEAARQQEAVTDDDGTRALELADLTLQLVESAIRLGVVLDTAPGNTPGNEVLVRFDGPEHAAVAAARGMLAWHADVGSLDVAATIVGREDSETP